MESPYEPRSTRTTRRRAAVACIGCRKRKVRCDVARFGVPCSNCRLDSEDCSVTSKRGHVRAICDSLHGDPDPISGVSHAVHEQQLNSFRSSLRIDGVTAYTAAPQETVSALDLPSPTLALESAQSRCTSTDEPQPSNRHQAEQVDDSCLNLRLEASQETFDPANWTHPQQRRRDRHVLYTHYPFLRHNNFSSLQSRDFSLLEAEDCFRVPHRQALDEFVRQYFIYIHPVLPMMDETRFWQMYEEHLEPSSKGTVALVLLQAMLFAASHCVSANIISSLGFSSAKRARAEYYRRAKLLYDISAENAEAHELAQAALLLTFWSPPGGQQTGVTPNSSWLVSAIQHAYTHHAHLYQKWNSCKSGDSTTKLWKRIWWCCIIRDRSISLGLSRAPQITHSNFDFRGSESLSWSDLYGEGEKPRLFSLEATIVLRKLLQRLISLCILLTDFQVFSQNFQGPSSIEDQSLIYLDEVRIIKASLRNWYAEAGSATSNLPGVDETTSEKTEAATSAILLHTLFVNMYYYCAAVSLSHYELLLVLMAFPAEDDVYAVLRLTYTSKLLQEAKDACGRFAQCMSKLAKPKLMQLLPISTTAFLVMPLIHHLLDLSTGHAITGPAMNQNRERLGTMIEALKTLATKYDGVEWVSNLLKQSLEQNNLMPPSSTTQLDHHASQQANIPCSRQQRIDDSVVTYLRVTFTAEIGLSRSKFTRETDLPRCLASLFQQKASSISTKHGTVEYDLQQHQHQDVLAEARISKSPALVQAEWEEFFELD